MVSMKRKYTMNLKKYVIGHQNSNTFNVIFGCHNYNCIDFVHSRWKKASFVERGQDKKFKFCSFCLRIYTSNEPMQRSSQRSFQLILTVLSSEGAVRRGADSHQRRIMRLCYSTPVLIRAVTFTDQDNSALQPNTPKVWSNVRLNWHFLFFSFFDGEKSTFLRILKVPKNIVKSCGVQLLIILRIVVLIVG